MVSDSCPKQEDNGDDRLSNLPEHILLTIIDRLDIREAARTSVLSGRWRHLPAMLSRLVINVWDFLDAFNCNNAEIVRGNEAVVKVTKSILARRDLSRNTIQFLCMTFFLREDDPISIGHAVAYAMATQKVQIAEFTILTERDNIFCDDDDLVIYGRQLMLFFDACPNAFGGLTRLNLENMRFGESDIPNVLNTCKRLNHLRLFHCDSGSWTVLQVEHTQLSELAIVNCSFERVELNSLPKLTRIVFEGWISFEDPLSFGYVPLLDTVSLTNVSLSWHKMIKLSKFLRRTPSVRRLKLGFNSEKIWVQPECLTERLAYVFHQLRFVNLSNMPEGYDLTWTLFILKAAPNLKELYMSVWDHLCEMKTDAKERKSLSYSENKGAEWEPSATAFHHQSLVTLAIFGFRARDYMMNYVRRVVETAVNLKDVFLYDRLTCDKCRSIPSRFPPKWKQDCVEKFITNGIKSSAIMQFQTIGYLRPDHVDKLWFL
ncbi:F-box/FBD/LRR-repeat protein At2g04230-like isoform X2 [Triticum dicoccoides]|uniref:F-box/FBD/LRR-repeat protein At2g04230-like isoform X2 n=1 Tax=Triticum dicoccoides TaxID=85692 RepID=UPI000E7C90D7|nr:F-box/FBD/LRR-repeat protein At2g04230-like isoform X2 [Triticum dicoccoides]